MSKTPKSPPDTEGDGKVEAPWENEQVVSESGTSQSAQCAGVGGKLEYVQGDLFSCPATHSLAHCISEDCRMGAGIAVLFKKKFNGVPDLVAQEKKTGECAVLKRFDRFIYYLITKKKYNHKPTYETLRQSLEAMRAHCLANNVTRISMPRIGCGLDRLSWKRVSVMIEEVFLHTNVAITVYVI